MMQVIRISLPLYHLSKGQVAGSSLVFIYIKHPHFLHVDVTSTNSGQLLQISNLRSASSGVDRGVPFTISHILTLSLIYYSFFKSYTVTLGTLDTAALKNKLWQRLNHRQFGQPMLCTGTGLGFVQALLHKQNSTTRLEAV
jgi:hypothetical protein